MLKEIATYIANNTSYTIGTNLFTGHTPPESTGTSTVILNSSGGNRDYDLPDKRELPLQFICRSRNYFTAYNNAEELVNLLHGSAGITLPVITSGEEYLINTITIISTPTSIGKDDKGRHQLSFNLLFHIQDAP